MQTLLLSIVLTPSLTLEQFLSFSIVKFRRQSRIGTSYVQPNIRASVIVDSEAQA